MLALAAAVSVVAPLLTGAAAAEQPPNDPTDPAVTESYLEDPRRTGEGQEPQHAFLRPHADATQALAAARQDTAEHADRPSPWTKSLDGTWRFRYDRHHRQLPENWQNGDSAAEWGAITVPGVWQQQGHGHPIYRNVPSEVHPYDAPKVPDDVNPTGAYVRQFDMPQDWDGRRQLLRFEGATSGAFVWVNGHYVGYDQGGYTPAEYDVTEHLRPGENTIAVRVHRWGAGSYLENMDMWHFSGLFRSVHLYSVPRTHLEDVTVRTPLDESRTNATLGLDVDLRRIGGGSTGTHRVRATLHDPEGAQVARFGRAVEVRGERTSTHLEQRIHQPRLWSDETPELYTVVLELLDSNGQVVHTTQQPVGFREIEVRDEQILLNGEPVTLRGVNRHEHDPRTGRTVSREAQRQDARLMRQHNINAVRTSHYPSDPFWYRLADRNGLLLADEVDIETHYREWCGATDPAEDCLADRPEWQQAFADRFNAMLERDKNHPSVLFWDTGNEAGLGRAHFRMAEHARENYPNRLLYHQSNSPDGDAPYADVSGPRYPSPRELEEIAGTTTKPVVMGEWLHAMGNSLGHYEDMWRTIRSEPSLQGGFVWDWIDQGLSRPLRLTPDSSGNDIPVHFGGNPKLVPGAEGSGLALSGMDDWAEAYRDPKLDIAGKNVSLDLRVKPLSWQGSNTFLSKGDEQWSLQMPDPEHIEFFVHGNGTWHTAKAEIPDDWWGNWHRLTGTYDGSQVRLFLDGEQIATEPYSGEIDHQTMHTVSIGRSQEKHDDSFAGRTAHAVVDSVRIYDEALPKQQVASGADPSGRAVLALDFESEQQRGRFMDYGTSQFVANGVVRADRTPQPELAQMSYSHAPIRFEPVPGGAEAGRFTLTNLHHTLPTSAYELRWKLMRGGAELDNGQLDVEVGPGESEQVDLNLPPAGEIERFLVLEAVHEGAAPGVPAGHVLASEQLPAGGSEPAPPPEPPNRDADGQVRVQETAEAVTVAGEAFRYSFDRSTGAPSSMRVDGTEHVVEGPQLDVFRAPTGNEWSDWSGIGPEQAFRTAGLDRLETRAESIDVRKPSPDEVQVVVDTDVAAPDVAGNGFDSRWTYTIDGSGAIRLDHAIEAYGQKMRSLPWLPRAGFSMRLPESFSTLDWYGRGPGESYPDRKDAQHIGRWSGSVDEQWFDHLPPQDNGVKVDTSWASLSGADGGMLVSGDSLAVSADRYSNAERTDFAWQLRRDDFITFHVSADVTGLGDTPVPVQERYRVRADERHTYSVVLRPTA